MRRLTRFLILHGLLGRLFLTFKNEMRERERERQRKKKKDQSKKDVTAVHANRKGRAAGEEKQSADHLNQVHNGGTASLPFSLSFIFSSRLVAGVSGQGVKRS